MHDELNRLTLSFANLLQDRGLRMSERRNLSWMALNSAIINYSARQISGISLTPLLPDHLKSSASFLQFAKGISCQRYNTPLVPSIVPFIQRSKEGSSPTDSWPEMWMGLAGVLNRFSHGLGKLITARESPPAWSTITSGIWLNPTVAKLLGAEIAIRHPLNFWNPVQQSMVQSFTEKISQGQLAYWDEAALGPSRSLSENIMQGQWNYRDGEQQSHSRSIAEKISQGQLAYQDQTALRPSQSLAENILQSQWTYRDTTQHNRSRSIAEAFSFERAVVSRMLSVFPDPSTVVPLSSALPTRSPVLSLSPLFTTEFSAMASQQMPTTEKHLANVVPEAKARITVEPHETPSSFTFNGGIQVHITAQSIDPVHADETARLIASQVVKEISRLTDQSRFRRGLPTSNTF